MFQRSKIVIVLPQEIGYLSSWGFFGKASEYYVYLEKNQYQLFQFGVTHVLV